MSTYLHYSLCTIPIQWCIISQQQHVRLYQLLSYRVIPLIMESWSQSQAPFVSPISVSQTSFVLLRSTVRMTTNMTTVRKSKVSRHFPRSPSLSWVARWPQLLTALVLALEILWCRNREAMLRSLSVEVDSRSLVRSFVSESTKLVGAVFVGGNQIKT